MGYRPGTSIVALAAVFAGSSVALAGYGTPPPSSGGMGSPGASTGSVTIAAAGNPFTGGLKFDPAQVTVAVGAKITWKNTDTFVPHTATEDHGLWDLTGTYGQPIAAGFGPGEERSRIFEAGTQRYYCTVHPVEMKGVVAVPAALSRTRVTVRKRSGRKVKVLAISVKVAAARPAVGQAFDIERKRGDGAWKTLRSGSTEPVVVFRAGAKGTRWTVRARLRSAKEASKATDWSPEATITA